MSGDREARALAAGETIEVNGETYNLRPIVAQHLVDLERAALEFYKRQYLKTFSDNADLLGDKAGEFIAEEVRKVAQWGLDDLPRKTAYDVSRIPVNDKLKSWIGDAVGEVPETETGVRSVLSTMLDQERITPKEVKGLSGKAPVQGRIRYDQWWVTASMGGMVSFIVSSIQHEHPEVDGKAVAGWSFPKITEASRKVERITSVDMGNT